MTISVEDILRTHGVGVGSGGASFLVPYSNRVSLVSNQSTVGIGITEYDPNTDMLFVYQNSTYIQEGQDFGVSGGNVVKTSGVWESGTTLDFVVLSLGTMDQSTVAGLTITMLQNTATATAGQTSLPIGIGAYNSNTDVLMVYQSNLLLYEGTNWVLGNDGTTVELQGYTAEAGDLFHFVVWKKVKDIFSDEWNDFIAHRDDYIAHKNDYVAHKADDAIHKTSQQIRGEVTTPLRTEVVSSLPTSPQKGQLLFNEATGKFTGYDGGKWL